METLPRCGLGFLSVEDCWSILTTRRANAEMCTGVPLVAKELSIVGCPKLKCTSIHSLPSLHNLIIASTTLEEGLSLNGCMPLHDLRIQECNGFTSILSGLHSSTSFRTLRIQGCPNLRTLSDHGLQIPVSLEYLHIKNCPNLEAIASLDNLTSLLHMYIEKCDRVTSIPSGLAYCTSLIKLWVGSCHNLISLADHNLSSFLQSISSLYLSECGKLQHLPKGLHCLTRLKVMTIGEFWGELESFPDFQIPSKLTGDLSLKSEVSHTIEAMQRLTKLHDLEIDSCPCLAERCAKDSGPEWPKISHIPKYHRFCLSSHYVRVLSTHSFIGRILWKVISQSATSFFNRSLLN
ncbi:disease resistance protein RGA2-like [Pyrus ussuriensis x Pyrus communis]|uniref:Disease resistance protein RGA2-like n=1 Tax=Pyrus ussuriensis x Pyrus communis TaxID=2448454 RepID=A0A5N5HTT4_9ROSA|nr:disease resistance protein RGA2-like [Pyrus ussuriensis x Pyrus communis]